MRHNVHKTKKLGRQADHRGLLLRNLATSLVMHGRLETTQAKAQALQPYFDRIISRAKSGDNAQTTVRYLQTELLTERAQKKVADELIKTYADRASGFTRITPIGMRKGDGALSVQIELV